MDASHCSSMHALHGCSQHASKALRVAVCSTFPWCLAKQFQFWPRSILDQTFGCLHAFLCPGEGKKRNSWEWEKYSTAWISRSPALWQCKCVLNYDLQKDWDFSLNGKRQVWSRVVELWYLQSSEAWVCVQVSFSTQGGFWRGVKASMHQILWEPHRKM